MKLVAAVAVMRKKRLSPGSGFLFLSGVVDILELERVVSFPDVII